MEEKYKLTHTGSEVDSGVARALSGGAIDQSMSAKLDWEGLINPEFTIAQAGIGGNHGSVPYAADCWKLVSGTVSAAPGGGLVLNGTIRQTLETAVGFDAVASINVTSGTATAAYGDATKQFNITSSGGTIKRAHLGLTAIADWAKIPPADYGEELRKCQRYCMAYGQYTIWPAIDVHPDYIDFCITTPRNMRATPVVANQSNLVVSGNAGFSFSVIGNTGNAPRIRASKDSHGLSGNLVVECAGIVLLGADL